MDAKFPRHLTVFLFDLDGTLLDSTDVIQKAMQQAIKEVLGCDVSQDSLRGYAGHSLPDIMHEFDPERASALIERYRQAYLEMEASQLFPGIPKVLETLQERDYDLAVVTTKARTSARRHLEDHGILSAFPVIITSDDVEALKPDKEPVERALSELGRAPSEAIMIGDSPNDILAGNRAKTLTGLARWGNDGGPSDLQGARPDYQWRDPLQILEHLPKGSTTS